MMRPPYEGQEALNDKTRNDAAVNARETVGAKAACLVGHAAEAEDRRQNARTRKRAEALGDDVGDEINSAHAAREQYAERYRGVDVAARDIADAVSHADDYKTESESGQNVAAAVFGVAADEHRRAAAENNEHHGADELSDVLFYRIHRYSSFYNLL